MLGLDGCFVLRCDLPKAELLQIVSTFRALRCIRYHKSVLVDFALPDRTSVENGHDIAWNEQSFSWQMHRCFPIQKQDELSLCFVPIRSFRTFTTNSRSFSASLISLR